ncbi:Exosome RNA helicase MTR4 [Camelus dromedarius]|uniref:RNA helicase n=1 Tax=Camelus dromedarius TaxID=9838 RepID=A0A5N4EDC1_CAMDR|nr:Exosome RNA helicase MTR4 [Camelus dromedarius]
MADAFGDELFSVFEDDSTAAPGTKKDKEKEKGRWKGPSGSAEKAGKHFDGKLQSESTNIGKTKRDADFEGTDEPFFGKKSRVEESVTEDLSLADLMPRVKVALPADEDYLPLKPRVGKAAKKVLRYAIALALREKQRVIFTSPIKALSNQKYREMYEEFQDVGLMTGDVTINPTASCLVMTTEILRSMLYRGSEVMREVAWVIFDEIHYMRDSEVMRILINKVTLNSKIYLYFSERGVVWEETIILLPDNVHYVFLSATIPNARQFAEWICHLHKQPCHVIYTDYRPTPLQHYIFPAGGDGLHLVVDENGDFREDNFNTAMQVLRDAGDLAKGDQKGRKGGTKGNLELCFERILHIFSNEEKKMVEEVFSNAIDCLSDEDKKLPQVEHVLPLLKRGIGIHHGGLLPILKETIEILFSEGLIKALFATETFAMGINMPARTVLFTNARKFDGKDFRWISSGEYIQMSGRAGRRGMDDRGIVILMVDEKMSPTIGKQLLKGSADPLNSAFHLTYNMVLNLLRVEEINPEYMLEKSFYQFQHYRAIPGVVEKVKNSEEQYNKIVIPNEESVVIYYKIRQQLAKLGKEIEEYIHKPKYCLPFLQPGRLVKVKNEGDDFGWGVVVNFSKKSNVKVNLEKVEERQPSFYKINIYSAPNSGELDPLYVVEVLLRCSKESLKNSATEAAKPAKPDEKGEMQEVQKRFPDGVPLLDPIDDMGIQDQGLKKVIQKVEAFEHRMYSHPLHNDPNLETVYTLCEKKAQIAIDIKSAKRELKKARTVLQMDELKCRKRVLRRLGFATSSDVIEMKGRVACEISSADELLLTEMMFNGLFNDLSAEQATALLSCFVFQENSSEMPKLTEQLAGPLRQMQECAKRIAKVSAEAKLEIDEETYLSSFKPHLMDVVYTWATGATFAHICKMTDVFEGSIIRCMRRLEELLRQMCQAAKAIGNTELENKFAEGITKIKRDIVFAASLYL